MQLEVFESKQGTKVVTATNLHMALGLTAHHYSANVRKWLRDAYEFGDAIRRPVALQDYAKRPRPGEPVEDFFLTLELAKLITLRTNSKAKLKFARLLDALLQAGGEQMELFHNHKAA